MKIFLKDIRQIKYCTKGTRAFFKKYGLDYQDFIKNGIDEEKLLATNDSLAIKLVESAIGRK